MNSVDRIAISKNDVVAIAGNVLTQVKAAAFDGKDSNLTSLLRAAIEAHWPGTAATRMMQWWGAKESICEAISDAIRLTNICSEDSTQDEKVVLMTRVVEILQDKDTP